jgi:hypothetical protein
MPRAPPRCSHCEEVGHTRAKCRDLEVDKILQLCGGEVKELPEKVKIHQLPKEKMAEIQLLIEGVIPEIIFKTNKQVNVARKYEIVIVRIVEDRTFEKQTMLYSDERWSTIESTWKDYTKIIKDNTRLIAEKTEKYSQKLGWLERDLPGKREWLNGQRRPQNEFSTISLHRLFHVDYVTEKERLLHEQTSYNNRIMGLIRERNRDQRANQQTVQVRWFNPEPLPVISDTVFDAEDCPICMEPLGETSKVILRCGHQMCVTCMLKQTMLAAKEGKPNKCECPHCRVAYL